MSNNYNQCNFESMELLEQTLRTTIKTRRTKYLSGIDGSRCALGIAADLMGLDLTKATEGNFFDAEESVDIHIKIQNWLGILYLNDIWMFNDRESTKSFVEVADFIRETYLDKNEENIEIKEKELEEVKV